MPHSITLPRLSSCAVNQFSEPFAHGYIDNYLPQEEFRALREGFVDPVGHPMGSVLGHGKRRIVFRAPPLPEFMQGAGIAPAILGLIEGVASPSFIDDCWDWSVGRDAPYPNAPPAYAALLADRRGLGPADAEMQCEFSSLSDGVFLPPHADSTDKVLSCILYLGPDEWPGDWGGATEIYVAKDDRHKNNWNNAFLKREQMSVARAIEFKANRLVFFVKGSNAWHGVAPVRAPQGVERRSFNFSLILKKAAHENFKAKASSRAVEKLEKAAFRR